MVSFLEAVSAHRKEYGLPAGKAPKIGSEEYQAVLARMGKQTKSFKKDMKEQKAIHRKGEIEEAKHVKSMKAAEKKAVKEEMKHQKMMASDAKKALMDLVKRARKGELTEAQIKAFSAVIHA